jgi:hypothetical protein
MLWNSVRGVREAIIFYSDSKGCLLVSRRQLLDLLDQRRGSCWPKKKFPSGTSQIPYGKTDSWRRNNRSQLITPMQ